VIEIRYFRHHDNERTDERIGKLLSRYGAFGYGVYWYLLERLYFAFNRELEAGPQFYQSASLDLKSGKGKIKKVVEYMVAIGLVSKFGNVLSSDRAEREALDMIEAKKRRTKAASVAGRASAVARQTPSSRYSPPLTSRYCPENINE
jgi:hypothetical protein